MSWAPVPNKPRVSVGVKQHSTNQPSGPHSVSDCISFQALKSKIVFTDCVCLVAGWYYLWCSPTPTQATSQSLERSNQHWLKMQSSMGLTCWSLASVWFMWLPGLTLTLMGKLMNSLEAPPPSTAHPAENNACPPTSFCKKKHEFCIVLLYFQGKNGS